MSDGITTGWEQAWTALGWLLGTLPAVAVLLALVAALVWLALVASVDVPHYLRVRRLRRQNRRSGRTT